MVSMFSPSMKMVLFFKPEDLNNGMHIGLGKEEIKKDGNIGRNFLWFRQMWRKPMTRKRSGKPNGRPPREFDQKTFEGLCHVWCTWEEMENILGCKRDSLDYWCKRTYGEGFREVYNKFADGGKASLRRNQLHLSKTNAAMCIWLGKQKLGQKEDPMGLEAISGELKGYIEHLKKKYKQEEKGLEKE